MSDKTTPALFITANVGSIFEEPNVMLKLWTEEFLSTVARLEPKFLALHCQEVGGKNYEQSMKHVQHFVSLLMSSEELRLFDRVRVFLDEDYSSAENFTALGNLYFIHESVPDILIWDFKDLNFVAVEGKEVHSGSIEDVAIKEKSKFPQDFFPECKWSRKGFLRTRWNLDSTIFDLVNIHLFHDASNFIAMETCPSVYSQTRQRALEYTLDRFHTDEYGSAPFFLFGDFNFRTDTQGVIKKLSGGLNPVEVNSTKNNEINKLLYRDEESQVILTLGKKEFSHCDHQNVFIENSGEWLKEFDKELDHFGGQLFEFPIRFPPSYPYEEDTSVGHQYMQTRCPAWCDRVVLSETAKRLVHRIDDENSTEYGAIGENTCMGDHKPVFLRLGLLSEAGRVVCCSRPLHAPPSLFRLLPAVRPSLDMKRLERTDSSNSVTRPPADDALVDFTLGGNEADLPKPEIPFGRLSSEGNMGTEFSVKNHAFGTKDVLPTLGEEPKYDRYVVKRVQSASFVEVPRVGTARQNCRCASESSWRARSVSITSRNQWKSGSRVRLISDSLQSSLLRLQSHHSSSDEDWFEEVSNEAEAGTESFESKVTRCGNDTKRDSLERAKTPEEITPALAPEIDAREVDLKTPPGFRLRCNNCWPIRCRRKRRLTKRQRDSFKSNASAKDCRGKSDSVHDDCCSIS